MKLRPLGDKLVVKVKEEEAKTSSGIVLPDSAQEKPQQGDVIAVGSGEVIDGKKVPLDVRVGDQVIKQSDVLAIVE